MPDPEVLSNKTDLDGINLQRLLKSLNERIEYVHNLRRFGVAIETITEQHGGAFAGNHARYVLMANVTVISEVTKSATSMAGTMARYS